MLQGSNHLKTCGVMQSKTRRYTRRDLVGGAKLHDTESPYQHCPSERNQGTKSETPESESGRVSTTQNRPGSKVKSVFLKTSTQPQNKPGT